MDYMTLKEASEKWGVTPRRVNYYCAAGRIPGAIKMATIWLIPKDAEKPRDRRMVADGYYLYRKKFSFSADHGAVLGDAKYPSPSLKNDPLWTERFSS